MPPTPPCPFVAPVSDEAIRCFDPLLHPSTYVYPAALLRAQLNDSTRNLTVLKAGQTSECFSVTVSVTYEVTRNVTCSQSPKKIKGFMVSNVIMMWFIFYNELWYGVTCLTHEPTFVFLNFVIIVWFIWTYYLKVVELILTVFKSSYLFHVSNPYDWLYHCQQSSAKYVWNTVLSRE